jgi:hypothetical protein
LLQFSLMSQTLLHLPKEAVFCPEWSQTAGTAMTAWNNRTECGLEFNGHLAQQADSEFNANAGVKFTQQEGLNLQLKTGYQLYNASWPSQPLQQVCLKKKINKYYDMTKVKNIYQVPEELSKDDIYDKRIYLYNICSEHEAQVRKCSKCRGELRQTTIEEDIEYQLISDSVVKVIVEGNPMLQTNYPVMGDPSVLYKPELSNSKFALSRSKSLFNKLHKMGLAQQFDAEIQRSLSDRHIRFLTPVEESELLSSWHCFAGLTYSIKSSSSTQKIRPCCDSSAWHPSGSLNSHLPIGTNLLNDMVKILTSFRLNIHAIAVDLERCYRSMKSD